MSDETRKAPKKSIVDTTAALEQSRAASEPVATPLLFRVIEAGDPMAPPSRHRLDGVDEVWFSRGERGVERIESNDQRRLHVHIPDIHVSATHAILSRLPDGWLLSDRASTNGTHVDGRRVREAVLTDGSTIAMGQTFFVFRDALRVRRDTAPDVSLPAPTTARRPRDELLTLLPEWQDKLNELARLATWPVSIVLLGESGTGKDVVARAIHALSLRAGGYVPVNCAAIPETLMESELFGYARGAFTGATRDRDGLLMAADRGTLFLDEIGEAPPALQAKLLRVLEDKRVIPVGTSHPQQLDFRVITASHRNIAEMVRAERFRGDLWGRLRGYTLKLPALRHRREDMGLLIGRILVDLELASEPVRFTPAAIWALLADDWPLNIRDLKRTLETAVALADGAPVDAHHLPPRASGSGPHALPLHAAYASSAACAPRPRAATPSAADRCAATSRPAPATRDQSRETVAALLHQCNGNITQMARALQTSTGHVRRLLRRYGFDADDYRR